MSPHTMLVEAMVEGCWRTHDRATAVGVPVALRDQLQFALWDLEDQLDAGSPTVSIISTVAQAHRVVVAAVTR